MTLSRLVYGRQSLYDGPGAWTWTPIGINIDDLRDILSIIQECTNAPALVRTHDFLHGVGEEIDPATAAPHQLRTVYVSSDLSGQPYAFLNLQMQDDMTALSWNDQDASVSAAALRIRRLLEGVGKPRLAPARQADLCLTGAIAVVLATYVWVLTSANLPIALNVLVGMLVGAVLIGARISLPALRGEFSRRPQRPVVIQKSRAELATERANRRANLRVGVITALVTGPIAVALGSLVTAWLS